MRLRAFQNKMGLEKWENQPSTWAISASCRQSYSPLGPLPLDKMGSVLDVDNIMNFLYELIVKGENSKKNEKNDV